MRWHWVPATLLQTLVLLLLQPAFGTMPVLAQGNGVLSPKELQNLLASGPEGTTILLRGGSDKLFYSPTLKNTARRSKGLGTEFLKAHINANTVAEGVFIARFVSKDQPKVISGIAGIVADKATGGGILFLLETSTTDQTRRSFERKDRLYAVLIVSESQGGLACRHSRWERLISFKGQLQFEQVPCEFQVGNLVSMDNR